LIRRVLSDLPRYYDGRYLDWLYHANPRGRAIVRSIDGPRGELRAHLGAIPQDHRDAEGTHRLVLGVNGVTSTSRQRRGLFTRIGLEIFAEATSKGPEAWLGLPNFTSTTAVCQHLGATLLGALPVHVRVPDSPRQARGIESRPVTATLLSSATFADLVAGLDDIPAEGLVQRWPVEVLQWRLAMPTGTYVLHSGGGLLGVSTLVPSTSRVAALLLKVWPLGNVTARRSAAGLVTAVARHHRVPVVLYAGFNRHVGVGGVPVPVRYRPAPLNLTWRALAPGLRGGRVQFDTFEFLDFDVL